MCDPKVLTLLECFESVPDPRMDKKCDHLLIDIIVISICASICDAEGWTDVETFGKTKQEWLSTFLLLPNGIPSHDTFGRVFGLLDAQAFEQAFIRWVESVFKVTKGQVIALDGKTLRGSHDSRLGKEAIHVVSAWAKASGLVLGQHKVDEKSNEITAIPHLLRLLDVSGCIVTIDAMGTQTKIARAIREEKADYVLRVKANQGHLYQDIEDWFIHADQVQFKGMTWDYASTTNKNHGRIEIRRCWTISDPLAFEYIRNYQGWTDLQTLIRVERERHIDDQVERDVAYYISSLAPHAQRILEATRGHWAIENSLHWVLDVTFREDDSRIRQDNAPHNMAIVKRIALNILKKDTSKGSLRTKRYQAALDTAFLEHLLHQI
jgi:predicted transposase YbfD/YdcC